MAEDAAELALDLSDASLSLKPTASPKTDHGETGDDDYHEAHVRNPNAPAAMDLTFSFHFEEKAPELETPIDAEKVLQLQWSSSDALPQEDTEPTIERAAVLKYKQSQPIAFAASEAPDPTEQSLEPTLPTATTLPVDPPPEPITVAEPAPAPELSSTRESIPTSEPTSASELSLMPEHNTPSTSDPTTSPSERTEPPSSELRSVPDVEERTPRNEVAVHTTIDAVVLDDEAGDTSDAKMNENETAIDEKSADLADAKNEATNSDAESDTKAEHERSRAPTAKDEVENHSIRDAELNADAKTASPNLPVRDTDEKPSTPRQPMPEADAKAESVKQTEDKRDAKTAKLQPRAASAAETYSVANLYPVKWDDVTAAAAPSLRRASTKPAPSSTKGLAATMSVVKKRSTSANATSSTLAQLRQSQLQHATEVARLKTLLDCVTLERDLALARAQRTHETLQAKTDGQEQLHLQAATAIAERDAFQAHCKTLQEAIRKEQVAAEDARKRAATYQTDIHQLKAKWSVCQGQVAALEAEKTALATAAETSKHEVYRVQAAHEKAMARVAKLQKEIALASTTHASERASWKRKLETLSADAKATAVRLQHEAASDMQLKLQSATMLGEKARREKDEATETLRRRSQLLESKLETAADRVRVLEAQLKVAAKSTKKHAAALDLQNTNKRLETELHALRRFVALQQKQAPPRSATSAARCPATSAAPPRHDVIMMMPPAPIRIVTVDTAVQATNEEPLESENTRVAELEAALARLEDVVAAKTEQLTSLRALHAQELQLQARAFLARQGSTS